MTFRRFKTLAVALAVTGLVSSVGCLTGCGSATDSDAQSSGGDTEALSAASGPSDLNTTFDALYSVPETFDKIADKAYGDVGYDTPPCATFMSYALETLVGVSFPTHKSQTLVPQFNVSLPVDGVQAHTTVGGGRQSYEIRFNTTGLATYLMETHKWNIVWTPDELLPGDVVFILPADFPKDPSGLHSAHTYMFHKWIDQAAGMAFVIDNEADGYCAPDEDPKDRTFLSYCNPDGSGDVLCCAGPGKHMYKRSVKKQGVEPSGETDPQMWYALRAPSTAPVVDAGYPVLDSAAPVTTDGDAGAPVDNDAGVDAGGDDAAAPVTTDSDAGVDAGDDDAG